MQLSAIQIFANCTIVKVFVTACLVTITILIYHEFLVRQKFTYTFYSDKNTLPSNASSFKIRTINPLRQMKIEQIKRDLNDTTEMAKPPAGRIGKYLLLNPNICSDVDHIDIIIMVYIATDRLEKRQRIRDSFAQASLFRPFEIRVAFLLGKTHNKTLERILWLEHAKYNDTIMGDFIDTYHNLTLKGVMGFRWISQYCSHADFVLKLDDDMIVNMFYLLHSVLAHMRGKRNIILCHLFFIGRATIYRYGKWKVDSHIFPSKAVYPYNYCNGPFVLMTSDLIEPMYEAAKTTPFFWIDDIYLFGMLPCIVGNITFFAANDFVIFDEHAIINCTRYQGAMCPIFATGISDEKYWTYWSMIKDIYSRNDRRLITVAVP
jgi:hypothetical protein